MANTATKAELLKQAAKEPDTVKAAHLRRMADGVAPLRNLTKKIDIKRKQRESMIGKLKPIVPVIEALSGPNEPRSNDITVLQKLVDDLKAEVVVLSGQAGEFRIVAAEAAAAHEKALIERDTTIETLEADVIRQGKDIAAGKEELIEASEKLKEAIEQSETLAASQETELAELRTLIAERDKQIGALQAEAVVPKADETLD